MSDKLKSASRQKGFPVAFLIVCALAVAFALAIRSGIQPAPSAAIGTSFPTIEAVGWINGPAPDESHLQGRVLVVDAWAYWCGPCRALTPTLVKLHEKYKDRGVQFIGLTSEGSDSESLGQTTKAVEEEGMTWPNGYGADKTLTQLQVEGIPQLWVVDAQKKITFHQAGWSPSSAAGLEQAIVDALATVSTPAATAEPKKQDQ
ncbi:TlpA family protein disulfide reductase [Schlesneria paludicola]|uniref:TlpA family protein disulfide reductase n=1 Tax=Schlesneria paludicola TaxID=360056 RepID=UPI00029A1ECC|nr:TlpA disulfide reductase family protein [Schlesneria paludicola]